MHDVAVIGGGITGLGVAREAALDGFSTVLFEKGKLSEAASGSSLRIMHGGFRYLQTLDLKRVLTSIAAQRDLLRDYPSHISPLPCLMPLARTGLKSAVPVRVAAACYNALAKQLGGELPASRLVTHEELRRLVPGLVNIAPNGMLLWHDALLHSPDDFARELQKVAVGRGLSVREGCAVTQVRVAGEGYELALSDGTLAKARTIVNAAGAWLHELELIGVRACQAPRNWVCAFNVVLKRKIVEEYAVGLQSAQKRLFFVVPRGDRSAVGTGQTSFEGSFSKGPSEEVVSKFISEFAEAFPASEVSLMDVESVEWGHLPAINDTPGKEKLYGSTRIHRDGRYFEVLSTKYTTFQVTARALMAKIRGELR